MTESVLRLYPIPAVEMPLRGLYLAEDLRRPGAERPFVYTNFITSLDGRIAQTDPVTRRKGVPRPIANRRDWRLFLELAAQSDVLLTTGRHLRAVADDRLVDLVTLSEDLMRWRQQQDLPARPQIAVVSESLTLPVEALPLELRRRLLVLTSENAKPEAIRRLERADVPVQCAGTGPGLLGNQVVETLAQRGLRTVYSIAGPRIHRTLLGSGVLDRLYLTLAHRVLGGEDSDSLVRGAPLEPPPGFALRSLYLDAESLDGAGQLFTGYEQIGSH